MVRLRAVPRAQIETGEAYRPMSPRQTFLAYPGATDVGLCAARLWQICDGADQADTAAVLAGHRRHRCTGRVIWAGKTPRLLPN